MHSQDKTDRKTLVDRRTLCRGLAATVLSLPAGTLAFRAGRAVANEPERAAAGATRPHDLRAAPAALRLKPDASADTPVWAYADAVPGPLLRVRRGEPLALTLRNDLPQPTTLHWYGVRLANAMDGVAGLTQDPVAIGGTFDVGFTPRDAGTFWYRPCLPALAAEQVERGLYGLFVVDEAAPPDVERDLALILDDWALTPEAQIRPSFGDPAEAAFAGRLGNWLTVNGRPAPKTITLASGGRARLRVLNAANARPFTLRFDGLRAHVLAVDGQPTEPFQPARGSLSLVPGTRRDLLIEAPAEAGGSGSIVAALGQGVPLLVVRGEGEPSPLTGAPIKALPPNDLPEAIDLSRAARADLVIEGGLDPKAHQPGQPVSVPDPTRIWRINGTAWPDALAKPGVAVRSGTPVVLTLINRTSFLQALHIHGHAVRQLHALDDGWEPYWLDTVPVLPGQTVRIAFVADNPGRWMIGSSILERLSSGLATWFEVT